MPTIKVTFPGGRYHATPWGHHVNEGQIEWPPSPWRLLRALIAVGYAKLQWDEVPEAARRLVEQLASVLPEYVLPAASSAHSRHYMPVGKLKSNKLEDTTLVFDTWANVGDGEMVIHWPCELDDECTDLFAALISNLGYLGRSESWVEAEVIGDHSAAEVINQAEVVRVTPDRRSFPHRENEHPGPGFEQIHLMAATNADSYTNWRKEQTQPLLDEYPLPTGRKPTKAILKKRDAAVAPYPADLIDCLQKDTSWWKGTHKWSQPPGSRRVLYWRRMDALVVAHPARPRRPQPEPVEAMLLALSTSSRNKSALPSVTRTLPQAELFHHAIVSRVGNGQRVNCPELTGMDQAGEPLKGKHEHVHILPLDLDADLHIDHVLVWAPKRFEGSAQRSIRSIKRTWTKGGVGELQVAVVGRGSLEDLRSPAARTSSYSTRTTSTIRGQIKQGATKLLGPVGGSTNWISQTPYVPPRFMKKNGRNSLEGQLREELKSRYDAVLTKIEVVRLDHADHYATDNIDTDDSAAYQSLLARQHRHFVRKRKRGKQQPPVDVGYTILLSVQQPLNGPVCLGYGSHFGLGLFFTSDS